MVLAVLYGVDDIAGYRLLLQHFYFPCRDLIFSLVLNLSVRASFDGFSNLTSLFRYTISKSLYCINRNVHPDPVGAVS